MENDSDSIKEFRKLCGIGEFGQKASYGSIKKWFVEKYDLKNRTEINSILGIVA